MDTQRCAWDRRCQRDFARRKTDLKPVWRPEPAVDIWWLPDHEIPDVDQHLRSRHAKPVSKHDTKREKLLTRLRRAVVRESPDFIDEVQIEISRRTKARRNVKDKVKEQRWIQRRVPGAGKCRLHSPLEEPGGWHTQMLLPRQGAEDGRTCGWGRGSDTSKASLFPGGSFGAHPRYASLAIGGREPGTKTRTRCEQDEKKKNRQLRPHCFVCW